ncbi:chemotaxis protein [Corynebacterium yonathiae]|uniref:Chemotaxis protein n=1 Tax=Corynebacterium yonathiae TaxID=2913504 RepID=A0ABU8Y4Q0_9CORY|nr:chemotaxis protein [uncultured Corynebacterium sp.]
MLILIAMVISVLAVIKKLDDIDRHLKELLASQEDDETPC